jgi:uncharacterized protein
MDIASDFEKPYRTLIGILIKTCLLGSAYLFGSHAKGTSNQWSDKDLAIVSPDFSEDLCEERLILMRLSAEIDDRIEPKPFRPEIFTPIEPLVD